jgi:Carboxypeptidase regulatory-like domain/TonB dependent receptor
MANAAFAQSSDAEITGLIKDPSGSAIPGTNATLTNQDSGVKRAASADQDGRYRFSAVPPGRYSLRLEAAGFKTATVNEIVLLLGAHVEHDVSMTVGSVEEAITVSGEVQAIDTSKNEVAGVVTSVQIDTLPVNTRQYLNLALLMPGTSQDASRTFYNSVQMAGAGRFYANGFMVDGVVNTWAEMGEPRQNFPEGAVEEFKVNTTQYKAESGLSMGGLVSVVTKSGTNQFHGDAFEYFRDAALNRDNTFQKQAEALQGTGKAPFRRNQFGFDVGGPIIQNKMHFYAAFERTQTDDSYTIFTGAAAHQFYSANEGVFNKPFHDQLFNGRVDYQIDPNQRVFARYSQEWNLLTYQGCGGSSASNCYDGEIPRRSFVAGHTWTPKSTVVNDIRFQYAYASYQLGPSGAPIFTELGKYPPERFAVLQTVLSFPSFSYGFGYADVGVETRWQFKDDLSWQKGKHSLKFGFDVSHVPFADDAPNNSKGTYTFATDQVFNPKDPATVAALKGATLFTAATPPVYTSVPTTQLGFYFQDDWKVRRNVTLSLGLRYDREFGSFNEDLDPKSFPITIPFLGDPSKRGSKKNFGPRVGVAWDIMEQGKDVVRAGFGIYYNNLQTLQNFPENRNLAQCAVLISNPPYPDPYGGKSPTAFCSAAPPTVTVLADNYANPYTQQFNIGYSRQLNAGFSIHADGVYMHTFRDYRNVDVNYPIGGARPIPAFARIILHDSIAQAKYKAFYLRAEKRFNQRFQFLVSYSLASNRDNNPQAAVTNYSNWNQDWGPSAVDRRHNLVASGSVLLPWKVTFGAIWALRSALPFSALANELDVDGTRQFVPGTSRNQGNRDLDLNAVNAYRANIGLPAVTGFDSSKFNSFDIRASRPLFQRERKKLEIIGQVFNLFGTTNLASSSGQVSTGGNQTRVNSPNFGKILGANNLQQAEIAVRFAF